MSLAVQLQEMYTTLTGCCWVPRVPSAFGTAHLVLPLQGHPNPGLLHARRTCRSATGLYAANTFLTLFLHHTVRSAPS